MLRSIHFLDCDFCHESHSDIRSMYGSDDTNRCSIEATLAESALYDGWCLSLIEETGDYLLMCHDCHARQSFEMEQKQNSAIEVDF